MVRETKHPTGQIGVWGDSLVHGGNDLEHGGWATRQKLYLMRRKLGDHVFDLGIGSNNSQDVLERLVPELRARQLFIDYVLISVGLNDLAYDIKLTTPDTFQANLAAIASCVRDANKWLYLLTITPTNVVSVAAWEERNDIIRHIAEASGAGIIVFSACLTLVELPDGVHPTAEGHDKIFHVVKDALLRDGAIRPAG